MPGIHHLTKSSAAITNYLRNQKQDRLDERGEPVPHKLGGYYDRGSSAPSEWHGYGAQLLGLSGQIDTSDFSQILEGKYGGVDVSERGGIAENARRKATDLTFKAPKSVALMSLVHGDKRLIEAHNKAVKASLDYIENEVLYVRRGKGGIIKEDTDNLTAALFMHEDSRAVDGIADPLLHTHAVIANLTKREDGEWSKVKMDFGHNNEKLLLAGDHYYSVLAREVKKLGYDIERKNEYFEISGISEKAISEFSRRSDAIENELSKLGLDRETATAKNKTDATMRTRGEKTQMTRSEQHAEWRQRARDLNIDLGRVYDESLKPKNQAEILTQTQINENAVKSAIRHLSERNTVFSENQVKSEALRASFGDSDASEISKTLYDGSCGLVFAGEIRQEGKMSGSKADKLFTSDLAILREAEILTRAKEGRGTMTPVMSTEKAAVQIEAAEFKQGFPFSDGQKEAATLAITSPDRHIAIVGAAGAGKTTSMKAIVDEFRAAGYEIIGVAPSSKASQELKTAGCDQTLTLAKALILKDEQPEKPRVYMLDEAGMVSARDYTSFYDRVEREGARSISVGDYRQLASVEAGSPFEQLIKSESLAVATIDQIQRQKDPELLAVVQHFATGDAAGGVKLSQKYITQSEDFAHLAAKSYIDMKPAEREAAIMMTTTNATRQAVNAEIRQGLKKQGSIGADEIKFAALDKVDFTREELKRADKYEPGMIVRLNHGIKSGENSVPPKADLIVKSVSRGTLIVTDKNNHEFKLAPRSMESKAYKAKTIALAEGDKIVFRDNDSDLKIDNGYAGTVKSINPDTGAVKIHVNGRDVDLSKEKTTALDYAYCRTIHSAQGATFDKAIIIGEAAKMATAQLAYVGVSRARHEVNIFTDNSEKLSQKWQKWGEKKTAMESINAGLTKTYMTTSDELSKKRLIAEHKLDKHHAPGDRNIIDIEAARIKAEEAARKEAARIAREEEIRKQLEREAKEIANEKSR